MSGRGFTLIEVMVTCAVFALLSTLSVVSLEPLVDRYRCLEAAEALSQP